MLSEAKHLCLLSSRCWKSQPEILHFVQNANPVLVLQRIHSRACRHNRLRPVHIAVARLKLCFEFHFEPREIDQVPGREFPSPILLARLVFESTGKTRLPVGVENHFSKRNLAQLPILIEYPRYQLINRSICRSYSRGQ